MEKPTFSTVLKLYDMTAIKHCQHCLNMPVFARQVMLNYSVGLK